MYAKSEWQEPGTRIEMEQEKEIMYDHLSKTLSVPYLEELRREKKPLVIIEGGAGPDLRTISTVSDVLVSKSEELQGIPEGVRDSVKKLFSRFDEAIENAKKIGERRESMTFEELLRDMGYAVSLSKH